MSLKVLFLAVAAIAAISEASVSVHDPFYCFATDPVRPQNQMFATTVAYEAIRGQAIPSASTCTPRRFWMFSRGGTRLPPNRNMQRMREIHDRLQSSVVRNVDLGRTQLCRPDFQFIEEWIFNTTTIDPERNPDLADTGRLEMIELARRYQRTFPNLLPSIYNRSDILFRTTDRPRNQDSLRAFGEGLYGAGVEIDIEFERIENVDRLMRPHYDCPLYDEVSQNSVERDAFEQGVEFQQMLEQVNRKLGFTGSNQLTSQEVQTVWDFCKFYQGWDPLTPSPWCAAFSIANHAVIEYFEDLDYYYRLGYGGDERLFSNLNCFAMQDLLEFLRTTDVNEHVSRIFNTHSRAVQLFLVSLGVFRDETHLTRHNFAQQTFRQYRSSVIAAMASNFVVIQHQCVGGDNDLQVLYNERPLWIPGCEAVGLCKQSTFLRIYERFVNANCDQLFCSRN